ncbi:MAG: carbamoyltransferase HypF [Hyphomonas sp.]|uniref:carbamoyltransferase HypF n=1 Tax=Hyphomonas sp. TaxID=87 RepID=UPI0035283479
MRIRGAVQGVGFRPFVWSLAHGAGLTGWVRNDSDGVLAEIEGDDDAVSSFLSHLQSQAPPLSRIDTIETQEISLKGDAEFQILTSSAGEAARTIMPPDVATCGACLADMFDPANRRHLYAFTNCTHCGPRYTITRALPYDRPQTSMAPFIMCASCQAEYENPADRRFHAQPNACPDCGPQLSMAPSEIVRQLEDGRLLAIKGLGGFHLAADAQNEEAVGQLRNRKARDGKPFAIMVANIESARRLAELSPDEEALLTDPRRPIVVCPARSDAGIAASVSNGLPTIGLMLPYTPLHYLIFHAAMGEPEGIGWLNQAQDFVLVMTSANPGGEPLVITNQEATERLGQIADTIVTHDRDILIRCDDSVVRMIDGAPAYLRRARGYTPEPIPLSRDMPPILAVGALLKNTICVTRGREAFLSQHVGDLDNAATLRFFREAVAHMTGILDVEPELVACDLHPDFLSARYAESLGLPLVPVQHHHAHIAAVAAEHHLDGPHLGLALDGFGLGADGASSWGGEFLKVDGARYDRLGHLAPLHMPGGEAAAREPWRMGAAALHQLGRTSQIAQRFSEIEGSALVQAMLERNVNAPETSSAGRLFDAACGLLGVRPFARFEGDAAMALEALATAPKILPGGWRLTEQGQLDLSPLLGALDGMGAEDGAAHFHGTLAAALADTCEHFIRRHALPARVLAGGGCFQNRVLTEMLAGLLSDRGIDLLRPIKAPVNDGGLSLGQAWVAANTVIELEG